MFSRNGWGCWSHGIKKRTICAKPEYATGVLGGTRVFVGWEAGSCQQLLAAAQWQDWCLWWPSWENGRRGEETHFMFSATTHSQMTQTHCLSSPQTVLFLGVGWDIGQMWSETIVREAVESSRGGVTSRDQSWTLLEIVTYRVTWTNYLTSVSLSLLSEENSDASVLQTLYSVWMWDKYH